MTQVVLLAHGSPDPRSGEAVRRAAESVAARLRVPVTAAFLEHDAPDLAISVRGIEGPITLLPLLLSTAFHARVDVPQAVRSLDREVVLLLPVGHPPRLLDKLLRRAMRPVVIVAAGTRVDEERAAFAQAVTAASVRTGVPAVAAFATGPGRRIEDASRPGGATVVPWLLAPGRLLDSVRAAALSHGCPVLGEGLLLEPEMHDELTEQLAAVLSAPGLRSQR